MNAQPEWPETEPNAETLLRYYAGRGVWLSAAMWPAMRIEGDDRATSDRIMYQMISAHDVVLLLSTLRQVDTSRADEMAARLWRAAEAGDGYGEWLFQWADEMGLDCEAISEDANQYFESGATDRRSAGSSGATKEN